MGDALKDIDAAILEVDVFRWAMPNGPGVEMIVTLLDIQSDAIAISKDVRDRGAQAFGMLFFKCESVPCPNQAVIWERFDDGLQITPADEEAHLLDDALRDLSLQAVGTFLTQTAQKDPK